MLPGIVGCLQANEALKLIAGYGEPLVGRLLTFDAQSTRFAEVKVRRDPELPRLRREPQDESEVRRLPVGRNGRRIGEPSVTYLFGRNGRFTVIRRIFGVLVAASMLASCLSTRLPARRELIPISSAAVPPTRARMRPSSPSSTSGSCPTTGTSSDSKMPQAKDNDPCNDLPLDKRSPQVAARLPRAKSRSKLHGAATWRSTRRTRRPSRESLDQADADEWEAGQGRATRRSSTSTGCRGTKVIGALEFGTNKIHGTTGDHGAGTTSVSVGNIHGTCPECLLMFIDINGASPAAGRSCDRLGDEAAVDRRHHELLRILDRRTATGSTADRTSDSSERRATAARRSSSAPGTGTTARTSSRTPRASRRKRVPTGSSPSARSARATTAPTKGHGKPGGHRIDRKRLPGRRMGRRPSAGPARADSAEPRTRHPTIAGIYGRALYEARRALRGPSWVQKRRRDRARAAFTNVDRARQRLRVEGREADRRPSCARACSTAPCTPRPALTDPQGRDAPPPIGEEEFLAEGHGSYFGLETGKWKRLHEGVRSAHRAVARHREGPRSGPPARRSG